MAQKNRTKEIWLIPKRVNLHQTVCLIDGIIERKYDKTSWNPQKQNNLGVNLKKWGATKDGKNISPQAIRTLVAAIPQYLGFLYINTQSTPNTICLTKAGIELWERHRKDLVKVKNLGEGKDSLITESEILLRQMEKLQITNPIIDKDCENILVFPFRFMLKVLLRVGYLDQEEIAYFLFKVRNDDELELTVREIKNFRALPKEEREELINAFRATHIGNITLVKASSAGYFISLCQITGIMDRIKITPANRNGSLAALRINEKYLEYVEEMLDRKYLEAKAYDFKDDLSLWIDYIGAPDRDYPPIDVSVSNKANTKFLVQVYKDEICKYDDLIYENSSLSFPMFVNEKYDVKVIDITTGNVVEALSITPSFDQREYTIIGEFDKKDNEEGLIDLAQEILQHCEASNFAGKTLNYLNTLSKIIGIDKTNDKSLRGAYFEYFVFKMLNLLKAKGVIDEVVWNGKIGKYGLPVAAPGGKTGISDIVFTVDNLHIVLELTTIKAKSLQFSAEGSSVPDHIRLYKQSVNEKVTGVFCAPVIHERNTTAMQSNLASDGIKLHCITDTKLVEILLSEDRELIKSNFA